MYKYQLSNNLNPFSNFMDDFFSDTHSYSLMRTDIKEEEDKYVLDIEMPSIDKKDIKIELNDGYLKVSASKEREANEGRNRYLRKERFYGSYSRSFYVGEDVQNEDISASLDKGVLTINIKKVEEVKKEPKTIEIN